MDSKSVRKGLFLVTITGALMIPGKTAEAADRIENTATLPGAGIEAVLSDCYTTKEELDIEKYLVPTKKGEYLDMAFADVETFLYIRSEPDKKSQWVGKLYPDYAAKIIGPVGDWTEIVSGSVRGYVKTEYIHTGKKAEQKAKEIIGEKKKDEAVSVAQNTMSTEKVDTQVEEEELFTYAESRAEEEARLKAEAEKKAREEAEAAKKALEEAERAKTKGQAVVDYASQFIGNPYVWGGTSLTNGADCSGFVQSVYKHFGVSMPRTSSEMRSAGKQVSYENAVPGDVICYDGHVGIYMGDGKIVNAINSRKGIGILSATYSSIITVRRML